MKEKQGEMKMLRNAIFLISFAINTTNVVTKPCANIITLTHGFNKFGAQSLCLVLGTLLN
jgi:hypothetical protein